MNKQCKNKTRLIGDIHGDFYSYSQIISDCERSIQVGDHGVGFVEIPYFGNEHEFIRGNHDDPQLCKTHSNFIPDGTVRDDVMFIGGAYSIDKDYRIPGLSWWYDEECSESQLSYFEDLYKLVKPRVMITHECPDFVADALCANNNRRKWDIPSRTRDAFSRMFMVHRPEIWVFGHWHMPFDQKILDTRFVCLDINTYIDLEI